MVLVSFELAWQQQEEVWLMAKWELMALRSGGLAVEVREQAWALPVPVARGLRVQRPARWILARWILDPWVALSGARGLVDPP